MWLGYKDIPKSTPHKMVLSKIKDLVPSDQHIYINSKHDWSKSNQLLIKVTSKSILDKIANHFGVEGDSFVVGEPKIKFQLSGGNRGSGSLQRLGSTSLTTKQQESAHLLHWETGKDCDQIETELSIVLPPCWRTSIYNSAQFVSHLKGGQWYLDSDNNRASKINLMARQYGLLDHFDNWNPADIWYLNISDFQIEYQTRNIRSLNEYNEWLSEKFWSNEIVGISLKKCGSDAKSKVVQPSNTPVYFKPYRTFFNPKGKNFVLELDGDVPDFQLRVGYKASSIRTEKDLKIYLEGRIKGSGVQLGGVSTQFFKSIANINFAPHDFTFNHSAVILKEYDPQFTELELKSAHYLANHLQWLLGCRCSTLGDLYLSSAKQNRFSSIHLKIY